MSISDNGIRVFQRYKKDLYVSNQEKLDRLSIVAKAIRMRELRQPKHADYDDVWNR